MLLLLDYKKFLICVKHLTQTSVAARTGMTSYTKYQATDLDPTGLGWINTRTCLTGTARFSARNATGESENSAVLLFRHSHICRVVLATSFQKLLQVSQVTGILLPSLVAHFMPCSTSYNPAI